MIKTSGIFQTLGKGKPNYKKAAQALAVLGAGITLAALVILQASPEKYPTSSLSLVEMKLLGVGHLILGFLMVFSALGAYRKRSWALRLGQAGLTVVFFEAAFLLFKWYILGDGQVEDYQSTNQQLYNLLAFILIAPMAVVYFFGVRYLHRLAAKPRHSRRRHRTHESS